MNQLALCLDIDPKHTAMCFIDGRPELFRIDFREWLLENWHIWLAFKFEANRIWDCGFTHWSARTIVHYLRHETAIRERSDTWKVNNNFSPDLGRLWECFYPQRVGFFEMRERKAA